MNNSDQRRQDLASWAIAQIIRMSPERKTLLPTSEFSRVSGDASFRRYFRLRIGESRWICVDAPPEKEDSSAFVRMTDLLQRHDLSVPEVVSFDLTNGFMLLTDLGEVLFSSRLYDEQFEAHYLSAYVVLNDIQRIPLVELQHLPRYTEELLQQEMDIFETWFLPHYLHITPSADTLEMLRNLYERLVDNALEQPQVLVHRDYHSRNLMWLGDERLAIIDYQDAVVGPVTYDLVSLLRDCYVRWPAAWVKQMALSYADRAAALGLCQRVSDERWLRWFDWMGLQRHIKVCGVFSRLHFRDGKSLYLQDIPLTVRYLLEVSSHYVETQPFSRFLMDEVLPALYRVNPEARAVIEMDSCTDNK